VLLQTSAAHSILVGTVPAQQGRDSDSAGAERLSYVTTYVVRLESISGKNIRPQINSFETRVAPKPKGCDLCKKENPPVRTCTRFLQMTVDRRSAYIKRKPLCLNCFARGSSCVIVKALIVALRAAAAITPYCTEATPPNRLQIPPRDPD